MHPSPVTVIIPTFNRAELLGRALRSIAAQTHRPIEVIIADDGSTDSTPRRIPAYQEQLRAAGVELGYSWRSNRGPAAARNRALKMSSGSYVCFLDSDDTWRPTFLATLLQLLKDHPTAALAFC